MSGCGVRRSGDRPALSRRPAAGHRGAMTPARRTIGAVLAVLVVALLGGACAGAAPEVTGEWHGRIEVPGAPLDIGLTLRPGGGSVDVPAQGTTDLPLTDVRTDGGRLVATLPAVQGRFGGAPSAGRGPPARA